MGKATKASVFAAWAELLGLRELTSGRLVDRLHEIKRVPVWMSAAQDDDLQNIVASRGRLHNTRGLRFVQGEVSQCHRNTMKLAATSDTQHVYGFALQLSRGLSAWVEHSWGLQGSAILETAWIGRKYFGAAMTEDDTEHFWSRLGIENPIVSVWATPGQRASVSTATTLFP